MNPKRLRGTVWVERKLLSWRGAACGLSIVKEPELRVARASWGEGGGSWALLPKRICCPVGEETACQIYPDSSQIGFLERVRIEMGDAKLEKQEEAREILSSWLAASLWEGCAVWLLRLQPPDPSSVGNETPQLYLRVQ